FTMLSNRVHCFDVAVTQSNYCFSLHDALPISDHAADQVVVGEPGDRFGGDPFAVAQGGDPLAQLEDLVEPVGDEQHRAPVLAQRSEEHTSELQSRENLVCPLLLENTKYRL